MAATHLDGLPENLPQQGPTKLLGLSVRDFSLLFGSIAIIGLTLFLWAYLTRRKHRHHLARSPRIPERHDPSPREQSRSPGRARVRIRKRRAQADNLPRNPTLGETGGLPPLRPETPTEGESQAG